MNRISVEFPGVMQQIGHIIPIWSAFVHTPNASSRQSKYTRFRKATFEICYAYCLYLKSGFSCRDVTKASFSGKLVRTSPRSEGHNLKPSYNNAVQVVFFGSFATKVNVHLQCWRIIVPWRWRHSFLRKVDICPTNYTASQPSSIGILSVVREQICELPLLDMGLFGFVAFA